MRYILRLPVFLVSAMILLFAGGFLHFVRTIDTQPSPDLASADAIIVLTGGPDRISGGIKLLSSGLATRLLISGVHPDTSKDAIRTEHDAPEDLFACCVEIEHVAVNTSGNARETARWVAENDLKSVILVTADFHMPRSLLEFQKSMPGLTVTPFPIKDEGPILATLWRDPQSGRRLVSEYSKYLVVLTRQRAETFSAEQTIARLRERVSL
ncbi:MAG: YdcF family protein [Pseudomonadota bacterium]